MILVDSKLFSSHLICSPARVTEFPFSGNKNKERIVNRAEREDCKWGEWSCGHWNDSFASVTNIMAYHHTAAWVTNFFPRTTRPELYQTATKFKATLKKERKEQEICETLKMSWCSLRGSQSFKFGLFVVVGVCKSFSAGAEVEVGMSAGVRDEKLGERLRVGVVVGHCRRKLITETPGHMKVCTNSDAAALSFAELFEINHVQLKTWEAQYLYVLPMDNIKTKIHFISSAINHKKAQFFKGKKSNMSFRMSQDYSSIMYSRTTGVQPISCKIRIGITWHKKSTSAALYWLYSEDSGHLNKGLSSHHGHISTRPG